MKKYTSHDKVWSHATRLVDWESGHKPAPVTVEWNICNNCDLGCDFCHFGHLHTKGPLAVRRTHETGDLADPSVVRRAMGEMWDAGVEAIIWTGGGEPTLHPDFVELAKRAAGLGFKQGLYTNGRHFDKGGGALREVVAREFSWAVISLDYVGAESYAKAKGCQPKTFHDVVDGVRRLLVAGDTPRLVVGLSFMIGADNYRDVPEMVRLGRDLTCDYVSLRPKVLYKADAPAEVDEDTSWVDEAMPHLWWAETKYYVECDVSRFEEYRDWSPGRPRGYSKCLGIRLSTTVTPDGRVWVCPNRMGYEGSSVGDLSKQSFRAAWSGHPGEWTDFSRCRAMCRLHGVNKTLAPLADRPRHAEFI